MSKIERNAHFLLLSEAGFTPLSSTCSTWVDIWSLRRFIDISDYVPLRPGKMHRWFRRSPWGFGGFGKLIWR
jgi:hypothetical protein